jgi:hypothetical protein
LVSIETQRYQGSSLQYEISEIAPETPAMELVTIMEPEGRGFSLEVLHMAFPPYLRARKKERCITLMAKS